MAKAQKGFHFRYKSKFLYLVGIAAVAVVYFIAAKFGLLFALATQQVSALWPPTAISLVALMLSETGSGLA